MSTELTPIEKATLQELEAIIERGRETFCEVGTALMRIRDGRLYRETLNSSGEKCKTFEEYCRERWGMERRHAYRLMESAKVVENVSHVTQNAIPTSERVVRPLTSLPPDQQREVWEEAVRTAPEGKVMAHRAGK
jgi:hypothetical protein